MPQTVNGGKIQFGVGFKTDTSGLKGIFQSFQKLKQIKPVDFDGSKKELKQFKDMLSDLQGMLTRSFNVDLGSINISKFNAQLEQSKYSLQDIYTRFSQSGTQGQAAFNNLASNVANSNLKLKQTKSLVDSLGQTFMNSIKWNIASSVINSFTGSIQQAFGYVKNLDTSLTNIRIVTGDSREQMANFAVEANNAAAALGKTTRDYTDAALSFYQQGLNDEEVKVRTEASLKAQNITQGQASVDELTAVWNGYQVSVADTQKYVDKLAAVADSSASDMSQLATAMSKVAATANVMGVDIDQLTAQIATIVATTRQAPQTVGNALKTIYARINDIKAGTDEAEVSLGNYSGKMAALGFNVLDSNGNLRQTGQVMEEIGERWKTLTNEQQVYLAQTMAGQRQYNQLISLFDNWTQYSEMLNVSLESEGTLNEKNARYMESLAAHMEQFTAARQNFMDSILNADDMKGFVDFGTNAINLVASLVDTLGGSKTTLIAIAGIFTNLFSKTLGTQLNKVIVNFQNLRENQEKIAERAKFITDIGKMEGITDNSSLSNMVSQWQQLNLYAKSMTAEEQNQAAALIANAQKAKDELNIYKEQEKTAANIAKQWSSQAKKREDLIHLSETDPAYTQTLKQADLIETKAKELLAIGQRAQKNSFRIISDKDIQRAKDLKAEIDKISAGGGNKKDSTIKTQSETLNTTIRNLTRVNTEIQNNNDKIVQYQQRIQELNNKQLSDVQGINNQRQQEIKNLQKEIVQLQKANQQAEKQRQTYSNNFGRQITLFSNDAISQSSLVKKMLNDMGIEMDQLQAKADQAGQSVKQFIQGQKQQWEAQSVAKFTGALTQTVTAALALKNTLSILGDESKTAGEKIESVVTGLVFSLPMLITGIKSLHAAFPGVVSSLGSFAVSLKLVEEAEIETATTIQALGMALQALLLHFLPIIATIGLLAGAIYLSTKAWNKDAEAAEKAAKTAEKTKQHYKELKNTIDDFNNSISAYDEAIDSLNKLAKGTDQWNQKLKETNEQVLQLLQKYPQLANSINQNSDGLLVIDKQSKDYLNYIQNLNNQLTAANVARVGSQAASDKAQRESLITDTARSLSGVDRDTLEKIINAQQNGNNVLGDQSKLRELLKEGLSSAELHSPQLQHNLDLTVEAIKNGRTQIATLINTLDTNTKATQILATTISQDLLKGNPDYQNSEYQDVYQQGINNLIKNASLKQDDVRNQWGTQGRGALIASYRELFGEDSIKTNFIGGNIRVKNDSGGYQEVDLDRLKTDIAAAKAAKQADSEVQKITQHIANAQKEFGEFAESALKFRNIQGAEDLDKIVNSLSGNEIAAFIDKTDKLKEAFDLDDSIITEEQLSESLKAAADKALDSTRTYITNNRDLAEGFSKIGDLQEISDKIAPQLRQQIGQLLRDGLEIDPKYMDDIGYLLGDALDADKLDEFLSIDFSNTSLTELKDTLAELGIQTDLSDEQLLSFLNTIQGFNPQNASIAENRNTLNLAAKQNAGEQLDEDQKEALSTGLQHLKQLYPQLGAAVDVLNQKWLAGTQQYTQALEAVKDADNYATAQRIKNAGQGAAAMKKEYVKGLTSAQDALDAFESGVLQTGDKIPDALAMTATSLSQLDDLLAHGAISGQAFAGALQSVSDTEIASHGLDIDKFETYCDLLRDTNEQLAQNEYLLRLTAEAQYRVSEGTTNLVDNWDDFNDAIQDYLESGGDISALAEDWDQLRQTIANTFSMDQGAVDLLGPDFVANHWDKLQAVKEGTQGAWQEMNSLMSQQIRTNVTANIDDSLLLAQVQRDWDYLQSLQGQSFTITADMDDTNVLRAMNNIAQTAGWTSAQAQAAFSQMGYDIQVEAKDPTTHPGKEQTQYWVPPEYEIRQTGPFSMGPFGEPFTFPLVTMTSEGYYKSQSGYQETYEPGAYSIKSVTANGKSNGGNISRKAAKAATPRKTGGGGGGKKGGGGGGKSAAPKKPKVEKLKTDKIDPYHVVNRALDDQKTKLKEIQQLEEDGLLADKLKSIQEQNKSYEEQIKLLKQKENIANAEQARLKNEITSATNGRASDVQVKFTATGEIANYKQVLQSALDKYNNYIANVYNKYSAEEQELHAAQKEAKEKEYEQLKKNLEEYEKTLDTQDQIKEAIREAQRELTKLYITNMKYRLDARKSAGELLRDWQDFSDKVIKDIADDDYLAQIGSRFSKIQSYINSEEVKMRAEQISALEDELSRALNGQKTEHTIAQIQEHLEQLYKEQKDDLQAIKELQKEISEQFLDSLDNVKDKFDDVIDQYGRVNDALEYGADLTRKLFGDEAYNQLNKFSDQLYQNNLKTLQTLQAQRQWALQEMQNAQASGNQQAYDHAREMYEDIQDQLNDAILDTLDSINDWWDSKIEEMADKMTRALSGGFNDAMVNADWDRIGNMDDTFLDAVNRTYGVGQIERLYQSGVDSLADSPKLQQRMNKLMNEQLTLLNEKDKLTQYDLDRAKALYDIEMKRYELEEARNNKTKMRLRRDSQGNYTYQYVEDEEKLADLQDALAKAENDLYNNDKEEYRKTLDDMYDTYQDYLKNRGQLAEQQRQLEAQLQQAQTDEEKEQIKKRLEAVKSQITDLDKYFEQYYNGLDQHLKTVGDTYLPQSISMNLDLDLGSMTEEEKKKLTETYVSFGSSLKKSFVDGISAQGGIVNAVINPLTNQLGTLTNDYITKVNEVLTNATPVEEQVKANQTLLQQDIQVANDAIKKFEQIKDLLKTVNEYLNNLPWQDWIDQLSKVTDTLLRANTKDENNKDTAAGVATREQAKNITSGDAAALQTQGSDTSGAEKYLPTSTADTSSTDTNLSDHMVDAIGEVLTQDMLAETAAKKGAFTSSIGSLFNGLGTLVNNGTIEQHVEITANFPNATDQVAIENAILNVVNVASQKASTNLTGG